MFYYIINLLISVVSRLIAITGHEFAHGWVSYKQGDPTPKYEGRLTFNPLAHLDPVGTILMLVTGFGWARPVGVNPMYYKDRKKGMAITAIAGPLANFIMAFAGILIAVICSIIGNALGDELNLLGGISRVFVSFAFTNLSLMVFNLIPIPPLDGSNVLGIFLPNRMYYNVLRYEQYAIILIMILSLTGVFSSIIGGGVSMMISLIMKMINLLLFPISGLL